ncbi:MAG: AAA family ATPase [Nitrospiraceae bacterium]
MPSTRLSGPSRTVDRSMWALGKPPIGRALLIGCAVAALTGSWLALQHIPLDTLDLWTKYQMAKGLNSIGMPYYEVRWPAEGGKTLTTVEELTRTPGLQTWVDRVSHEVGIVAGSALGSAVVAFGLVLLWASLNRPSAKMPDRPSQALRVSRVDPLHTPQPSTKRELSPKDPVKPAEILPPAPALAPIVGPSTPRPLVEPSGKAPTEDVGPAKQTSLAEPPAAATLGAVPTTPAEPVRLEKSYLGYWGLAELPFENVPDAKYYFPSPMHEEALHRLLYGIETQKGALMLTGEVGCGKTLISRALFGQLSSQEYDLALIANPSLEVNQFLGEVLYQLGIQSNGSKVELIHRLDTRLLENHKRGLKTVLVVDEAHIIHDELLFEELRLLLNFQLNNRFLLTLVLIGQPELNKRVLAIKQFAQRISIRYHLRTFNADETASYVKFRLKSASYVKEIFTPNAVRQVFKHSGGIPRNINTLCDLALLIGYMEKATKVDVPTIERAAADRQLHAEEPVQGDTVALEEGKMPSGPLRVLAYFDKPDPPSAQMLPAERPRPS